MAIDETSLTTVSAVEDELDVSPGSTGAYVEDLIDRYSDLFVEATGRPWARDDAYTESVKSTGATRLMLERRPVRSITSVTDPDGDTVDSGDYEIEDGDKGYLRMIDDRWDHTAFGVRRVEGYARGYEITFDVEYDGGYVTPQQASNGTFATRDLPESIELAVVTTVATAYRQRGQPSNIDSESIGAASVSFTTGAGPTERVLGAKVSPAFASAVRRHRDMNVL